MEGRAESQIERVRAMIRGEIAHPGVAELIGFRAVGVEPGRAVVELVVDERHHNPLGTLHGGVLCDVADFAMGMAYLTTVAPGETFTTLELKINFLRPVWSGKLTATGVVVKGGRTVGLAECSIVDEQERLVAKASCTQMMLRGEQGKGR